MHGRRSPLRSASLIVELRLLFLAAAALGSAPAWAGAASAPVTRALLAVAAMARVFPTPHPTRVVATPRRPQARR